MGVLVNNKIVAVHCSIENSMWELALWYPGGVRLVMMVGGGQLSHLATKSEQEIFCNLQYFSSTLFNQYQQLYIIPAINEFWEQHKQQVWEDKQGKDIVLSGDGRNDSPGHSAQYCTYSLADMDDTSILQLNVVDVREAAGKSNNMERVGFEGGMDMLLTSPMVIKEVVTDGHLEIAALMSKSQIVKCY
jgi:hypothetical protein